ncbi:MAG: hypothetical protein IEMM0006_1034 [bacterium]|nr:MAG: hypothetical protein IEMM0006_1034 [bacterium]
MKNFTTKSILISFLVLLFTLSVTAQETGKMKTSKKKKTTKTDKVKTGWNLGALPVVSFDSDLGFQYGALMNLYDYGDGSIYPNFFRSLYVEASRFTRGSGIFRVNYDTRKLIKGVRVYADVSFLPDQIYSFYGFNGYDAVYNSSWVDDKSPRYKTKVFYRYKRKFFRAKVDFRGDFSNKDIHWVAGVGLYSIKVNSVDVAHLNKGRKTAEMLPDTAGIYDHYLKWGIIPQSEKNGGTFTIFKAGFEYDSRDNEANPNKGIWFETVLTAAPGFTSSMKSGFLKLSITQRQYITLAKNTLFFDYRLGAQFTLAGQSPFYISPLIFYAHSTKAYNEGLGGAKTLRGVLRNRIIGDGIAYGNFELRWEFVKFSMANQNFYLGVNLFFDTGMVVQKAKFNTGNVPANQLDNYFKTDAEKLHNSAGLGLKIAMNQNFIVSVDYGKAFDAQDGTSGVYIGLGYLF